jgi:phosphate transport system substrate-binding protein
MQPNDQLSGSTRHRSRMIGTGIAIAVAVVLLIVGVGAGYVVGYYTHTSSSNSSSSTTIQLTETGSTLLYPLFKYYWFPNYTAPANGPTVILSADGTGSGAGQTGAIHSLVNIGASDAYLTNTSTNGVLNFPVAISAQYIYYNLPAPLNTVHLNLNGTILAMIYAGDITTWDNPLILAAQTAAVQSDLKAMSSETIIPFKRLDASGDTFLFTSICYESWSGFPFTASTSGLSGDTIPNIQSATGNGGMVTGMQKVPYSIGYIGISYATEAASAGLQYAAVGDNLSASASGGTDLANYILPSPTNISYDANLGLQRLDFSQYGLGVSLILGGSPSGAVDLGASPGGGGTNPTSTSPTPYPLVNLEYTIIKTSPTAGSAVVTSASLLATVQFEQWALSYGNFQSNGAATVWLNAVGFLPLTPEVIGYDVQELATVST